MLPATKHPKVSEHMQEIIDFVQKIIDAGYGYVIDGDVYFSVRKYKEYGKLSGRNLDDMQAGARVDVEQPQTGPYGFCPVEKRQTG